MSKRARDVYGGEDPTALPAYSLPYAASLVGVPVSTLRSWVAGRSYPTKGGSKRAPRVIVPAEAGYLSFTNLIEAHALAAMRREYQLRLDKIRRAVTYVEKQLGIQHPLARQEFKTDGVELFVEHFGKLLNVSAEGQLEIREALGTQLERVEYRKNRAVRLFPFVRTRHENHPKHIVIDPERGFGRPVLAGTGIPVSIIQERFKGGDAPSALATDYAVRLEAIEDALRAA